jgi:hypothetical protein
LQRYGAKQKEKNQWEIVDAVILQVQGRLQKEGIWLSLFHMHMVAHSRINRCPAGDCRQCVRDVGQLSLWTPFWPVARSVVEYMPYHRHAAEILPISSSQGLAISCKSNKDLPRSGEPNWTKKQANLFDHFFDQTAEQI